MKTAKWFLSLPIRRAIFEFGWVAMRILARYLKWVYSALLLFVIVAFSGWPIRGLYVVGFGNAGRSNPIRCTSSWNFRSV